MCQENNKKREWKIDNGKYDWIFTVNMLDNIFPILHLISSAFPVRRLVRRSLGEGGSFMRRWMRSAFPALLVRRSSKSEVGSLPKGASWNFYFILRSVRP